MYKPFPTGWFMAWFYPHSCYYQGITIYHSTCDKYTLPYIYIYIRPYLVYTTTPIQYSMDWFKGNKITGKPHRKNGKIDGFRLGFPLNQSIEVCYSTKIIQVPYDSENRPGLASEPTLRYEVLAMWGHSGCGGKGWTLEAQQVISYS